MIDPKSGIDFPFFQNQLMDIFGKPDERGSFARDYLTRIDLSEFQEQLGHVTNLNHYGGTRIEDMGYFGFYGNYVLIEPLKMALRLICDRGLIQEFKTFDGCFNIRKMKGGNSLSVHSWGLAVDFNAAENPFGGPVRFPDEFILCFAESGFEAGALWSNPDGMHFQLTWTSPQWLASDNPLRPIPWVASG